MKAVLVIDMPNNCSECLFCREAKLFPIGKLEDYTYKQLYECGVRPEDIENSYLPNIIKEKPVWCPLKTLSEIKRYPIQSKKRKEYIPFEMILEHEEQCYINHGQSVERLAERGGTSYLETYWILKNSKYKICEGNYSELEECAREMVRELAYKWLMKNGKIERI